jgi:hypothetical protein
VDDATRVSKAHAAGMFYPEYGARISLEDFGDTSQLHVATTPTELIASTYGFDVKLNSKALVDIRDTWLIIRLGYHTLATDAIKCYCI